MKNQLEIFSMIGHKTTDRISDFTFTNHFPDKPPVSYKQLLNNKAAEVVYRFAIPRDQILAFIFGQRERLENIYTDYSEVVNKISTKTSSTFHC